MNDFSMSRSVQQTLRSPVAVSALRTLWLGIAVSRRVHVYVHEWYPFVDRPLCKKLLPHTLDALATAYAIGTASHHFPYNSAWTASYTRME